MNWWRYFFLMFLLYDVEKKNHILFHHGMMGNSFAVILRAGLALHIVLEVLSCLRLRCFN